MLLLNTCVEDIEASPQPSPWEREPKLVLLINCLRVISYSLSHGEGGERLTIKRFVG